MKMTVSDAAKAAQGQWPRILPALGVKVVKNRHTSCPVCGGTDRFRFDDQEGRGTWICNQCGAGDGMDLVKKALSLSLTEAAARVNGLTGCLPPADNTPAASAGEDNEAARAAAVKQAQQLVSSAQHASGNAYLSRKGWPHQSCLTLAKPLKVALTAYRAGDLLVPLHDTGGQLVNVQLINATGEKRTLKGGQVKGACHVLSTGKPAARIWLTEGYATGLTVHNLTGDEVWIALSSVNLLSLAGLAREKHAALPLLIAADRDLNGDGQTKARQAAEASRAAVALPPVFGDWNDAFMQHGEESTRLALAEAATPPAASPFDVMSEAEFSAMSASEKAERVAEHYRSALAVDASGEILSRYLSGAWKVISGKQFERDVAKLFQRLRAPFSAGKISGIVDTLKLMLPQQADPARRLIGFRNGVLDTRTGGFSPHSKDFWLRTVSEVDYTKPVQGETLADHAPHFWQWLDRAAGRVPAKRDIILAALFMVLANRYDWQLFLEVTGPGGSGKSIMAEIATLLAGTDNTTSATIETLESSRERAAVIGYSLIILPDQEKWSGDGAGIKAITGGDAVSVDPKYRDAYSTHIPAVILAVNNNPMRFTDRSGGVSRRRVILHFPEIIPADERDPQLKEKISGELAVIVRQLMQQFSQPQQARSLLQSQQNSDEAMRIKRDADPMVDFCGYLFTTAEPNALYMGNASIRPLQPRRYLYHAYLAYMEANGYKNPLSMKMFGLSLESILREYGLSYLKRRTKAGIQTNLDLTDDSNADWLPKCGEAA
ncbi:MULTISPECIES: phage/plasmid primase, P4 family [unclassified Pantoea]|uniref:phage/plasmid primase, P4 family n=1 Tax=unclassified Pantoea TaxID=2630326 RepID=UPI00123262CC|nr:MULTISPECIES: phage/plasmid primase, P4 family [unclassified Pantoea]KAA5975230.1 DNA primase [Pantoea sp. M_6]KAA5979587.1 DNA primase [Pantoea sp. M_8]KAA5991631.1 DNA primase [Pantoea sp. M_10]